MAAFSGRNSRRNGDDDPQNTTLGAKIRHLIGVYGYRFGPFHTQDNRIAEYIKVNPATWTRLKSGKQLAGAEKLGALTEYFRLDADYHLTFEIFLLPTLEDFKKVLKEKGVGSYGAGGLDLMKAKLASALNMKAGGITIERNGTRAGGLGGPAQKGEHPLLRAGDSVMLRIVHPLGGHLLLLNDGPDKNIMCLMPSPLAPSTSVSGSSTRVPTKDGASPAFVIAPPSGRYRLYSVWTRQAIEFDFLRGAVEAEEHFAALPAAGLRQLVGLIAHFDGRAEGRNVEMPYEIRIADYEVIE